MIQLWQLIIVIVLIHQGVIGTYDETKYKVKLLNVVFCPGEKVPQKDIENYPTDPHSNHSYFPVDDGDLTNIGKHRMYEVGQNIRKKYDEFFGPFYVRSEIFARSSDIPRSQMSLQLVLAGLFPPVGDQSWNPYVLWQPVAISTPLNMHDILLFSSKCEVNINATLKARMSKRVKKVLNSHGNNFQYIEHHAGKPIRTIYDVVMLYNLFNEQKAHNLILPTWTEKVYPDVMKEIAVAYMTLRSQTKELRRYNGGFLLREILENIKAYCDHKFDGSHKKAFFYSAHDFNLMALARTLRLHYPIYPQPGSTYIFETVEDADGRCYISIVLWTGIPHQYFSQRVPRCVDPCPIEKFLELYREHIPTDLEVNHCRQRHSTRTYMF